MAAHLTRDTGGPPSPGRNEVLLGEAVDRLRVELDAARQIIGPAKAIYEDGAYDPVLFAELGTAIAAYDKAMGGK